MGKKVQTKLKKLSLDNANPRRPFYLQYMKELEEAQQQHD